MCSTLIDSHGSAYEPPPLAQSCNDDPTPWMRRCGDIWGFRCHTLAGCPGRHCHRTILWAMTHRKIHKYILHLPRIECNVINLYIEQHIMSMYVFAITLNGRDCDALRPHSYDNNACEQSISCDVGHWLDTQTLPLCVCVWKCGVNQRYWNHWKMLSFNVAIDGSFPWNGLPISVFDIINMHFWSEKTIRNGIRFCGGQRDRGVRHLSSVSSCMYHVNAVFGYICSENIIETCHFDGNSSLLLRDIVSDNKWIHHTSCSAGAVAVNVYVNKILNKKCTIFFHGNIKHASTECFPRKSTPFFEFLV